MSITTKVFKLTAQSGEGCMPYFILYEALGQCILVYPTCLFSMGMSSLSRKLSMIFVTWSPPNTLTKTTKKHYIVNHHTSKRANEQTSKRKNERTIAWLNYQTIRQTPWSNDKKREVAKKILFSRLTQHLTPESTPTASQATLQEGP